jgi:hypothetical protein
MTGEFQVPSVSDIVVNRFQRWADYRKSRDLAGKGLRKT